MSLPHLSNAYSVEQAVLGEKSKVVCLRFGQDFSPECMKMDEARSLPPPSPRIYTPLQPYSMLYPYK